MATWHLSKQFTTPVHIDELIVAAGSETAGGEDLSAQRTAAKEDSHTAVDNAFTAIGNQKETAVTNINALIDDIISAHSGDAGLISELEDLKAAIPTEIDVVNEDPTDTKDAIDDAIDTNIVGGDGEVAYSVVLQALKDDLVNTIAAGQASGGGYPAFTARTVSDPRCNGKGVYTKDKDTGIPEDISIKVICKSCAGWGATTETNTPTQTFPIQEDYKEEV